MDKDSLLDLLALIRAESVSLAAQSRNSSQSAYSRRLQAIEHILKTDMVDRARRPSGPTYRLKLLEPEIEAALAGLNRLVDAFAIRTAEPLRLAALHSVSANLLPRAFAAMGSILEERDIRLRSANHESCFQMLMMEEVMVIFIYQNQTYRLSPPRDLVHQDSVGFDEFIPVANPALLDTLREKMQRGDALPLISYPTNSFFGDLTRAMLLPQVPYGVSLKIVTALTQTVSKCIQSGLGAGWLPKSFAVEAISTGDLVEISELGFPSAPIELTMMRLRTRNYASHEDVVDAICAELSGILAQPGPVQDADGASSS